MFQLSFGLCGSVQYCTWGCGWSEVAILDKQAAVKWSQGLYNVVAGGPRCSSLYTNRRHEPWGFLQPGSPWQPVEGTLNTLKKHLWFNLTVVWQFHSPVTAVQQHLGPWMSLVRRWTLDPLLSPQWTCSAALHGHGRLWTETEEDFITEIQITIPQSLRKLRTIRDTKVSKLNM